jgi:hypothetical protein
MHGTIQSQIERLGEFSKRYFCARVCTVPRISQITPLESKRTGNGRVALTSVALIN